MNVGDPGPLFPKVSVFNRTQNLAAGAICLTDA